MLFNLSEFYFYEYSRMKLDDFQTNSMNSLRYYELNDV